MQALALALQLIPAFIQAIKALEEAIPGQGKGEAKLAALREVLESVDEGAKKLPISAIATALVKLFNATGVFRKSA